MKTKRILLILGSLLIYVAMLVLLVYFEHDTNESLRTLWDAIWYSIITVSTVGYGDSFPVTTGGKIVGIGFVIISVGFLGILISKISYYLIEIGEKKKMGYYGTKFENHVVILGWNSFTKMIAEELLAAGQQVAVIMDSKDHIESTYQKFDTYGKNLFILYAEHDDYQAFSKVNIDKSKIVHIGLSNDSEELIAIINLKNMYDNLQFVVLLEDKSLTNTFKAAGVTYVLSKNEISSKLLASYIFEPEVADLTADLLSKAVDDNDYDIQQFKVIENNPFLGKSIDDLTKHLSDNKQKSLLIAIKKENKEIEKLPSAETVIELNDVILFINNFSSQNYISNIFQVEQGA